MEDSPSKTVPTRWSFSSCSMSGGTGSSAAAVSTVAAVSPVVTSVEGRVVSRSAEAQPAKTATVSSSASRIARILFIVLSPPVFSLQYTVFFLFCQEMSQSAL